jgi:phytoene dehydrogenase-like protein
VNSYTNPSADLSAAFFIGHLQRTMFAKDFVGYMHGGWRVMYDAWTEDIASGGGAIVSGAAVTDVEVREGRVLAAIANGARYEGDAFVCTLPPQDAPHIAAAGSPLHIELQRWSSLEEVRALTIDLGFDRIVRDDLSFVFDVQQSVYYSIHSEAAPDLAPAGCQLLHAMAYLSPEEAGDDALRAKRRDQLIAGLDRHFAGWQEPAVVRRELPNAKVLGARRTPENIRNLVPLRSSSADNLFFAGDARDVDYNLTQGCLVSAMQVADAIVAAPAATQPAVVSV